MFDPDAVDPLTAEVNAQVEAQLAAMTPINELPPQVVRDAREEGRGIWGPIVRSPLAEDRTIAGPAGPMTLRRFVPGDRVRGVYLNIHGGGWVLGAAHHQDPRLELLARTCDVAVVSVEYRLAPEHPFPAGPDDCEAAATWLLEHAAPELGSDRLLIGGDSAGAHLSVLTLLRLRDRHGDHGFAGANLIYGAFDVSMTPSAATWGERNLVLSTPIIRWFADHFVPAERRRDPDVSPLYADLHGLPPALFTVGTLDPLLDDTLFMAARWVAAGNAAELEVYPGGLHGYLGLPRRYPVKDAAIDRTHRWVDHRLH